MQNTAKAFYHAHADAHAIQPNPQRSWLWLLNNADLPAWHPLNAAPDRQIWSPM
jgi:hypothetical protein